MKETNPENLFPTSIECPSLVKSSPLLAQLPGGAQSHRFPGSHKLSLFPKRLTLPQYNKSSRNIVHSFLELRRNGE